MRTGLNKLSARKILETTKPGYLLDGGGLYLQIGRRAPTREGEHERKPTEEVWKSWCFRYHDRITGRRREMGLGPLSSTCPWPKPGRRPQNCGKCCWMAKIPSAERNRKRAEAQGRGHDDAHLRRGRRALHRG